MRRKSPKEEMAAERTGSVQAVETDRGGPPEQAGPRQPVGRAKPGAEALTVQDLQVSRCSRDDSRRSTGQPISVTSGDRFGRLTGRVSTSR